MLGRGTLWALRAGSLTGIFLPGSQLRPSALPRGGLASIALEEEMPEPAREQQAWRCLVGYLCLYGFLAQLRPGESFITPYLLGSAGKNFTDGNDFTDGKNFTRTQAGGGWAV